MIARRNTTEYKKAIQRTLIRDNHMCIRCNRKDNLHVHHLTPFADGGNEDNINLITLCVLCHSEWENIKQLGSIAFSDWFDFIPYALLLGLWYKTDGEKDISVGQSIRDFHRIRFTKLTPLFEKEDFKLMIRRVALDPEFN